MTQDQRVPELAMAGVGLNDLDEITRAEIERVLETQSALSGEERDRLVVDNLGFAFEIAARIASRLKLRYQIEARDLAQDGAIGLIDAAKRYRKDRGASFKTFASRRVKGAILDRIRKEFCLRVTRAMRLKIDKALSDDWDGKRAVFLPEGFIPRERPRPDQEFEKLQIRQKIFRSLLRIPARERKVILMYYYAGMTNEQIAANMGFNYSRAAQLRIRGLERLRILMS